MSAVAEPSEAPSLAAAAKLAMQPPSEPREVTSAPKPPAAKETPAKPANEKPVVEKKPDATPDKPADESKAVFGAVDKPKEVKTDAPATDAEFEAKLADETKGMKPKEQAAWNELRKSERAAKDEARKAREEFAAATEVKSKEVPEEYAAKLTTAEERIKALELELEEADKILSVQQFERSKKYRREVAEPMDDLSKQADEIAARYEVAPATIAAALKEDPKTRSATLADIAADFNEPDRIELYSIAKDIDRLNKKAAALRDKAQTDMSALELEDRTEQEQATAAQRKNFSAAALRAWNEAAKTHEFLRLNEAAPEWTEALKRERAKAADYIPGVDAIADGEMVSKALQTQFMARAIEFHKADAASMREENAKLLARIESDNAHDPALGGSHEAATEDGDGMETASLGERAKVLANRR